MTQHYFGGLYPLRGLCGKKALEVVLTRDRQVEAARLVEFASRAQSTVVPAEELAF